MERSHEHSDDQPAPSQSGGDAESIPGSVLVSAKGFTLEPLRTRFEAGVRSRFEFRIRDYAGDIVASFEHVHNAGLHLVIVRHDLTLFQHLHPKLQNDGRWSLDLTLEQAGFFRTRISRLMAPRSRWEWTSLQTVNCEPSIRGSRTRSHELTHMR